MKILTFDPMKCEEVVAGILENGVFTKRVRPNHFMRKEHAYGISEDVLQRLIEIGCTTIRIISQTVVYESTIAQWFEKNIRNYGHGNQRFLPIRECKIVEKK